MKKEDFIEVVHEDGSKTWEIELVFDDIQELNLEMLASFWGCAHIGSVFSLAIIALKGDMETAKRIMTFYRGMS